MADGAGAEAGACGGVGLGGGSWVVEDRREGMVPTWTIGDGGIEGGADNGYVEGFVGRGQAFDVAEVGEC